MRKGSLRALERKPNPEQGPTARPLLMLFPFFGVRFPRGLQVLRRQSRVA